MIEVLNADQRAAAAYRREATELRREARRWYSARLPRQAEALEAKAARLERSARELEAGSGG